MADIYLYGGAASLNDIILRDPTTVAVVVIPEVPGIQGGTGGAFRKKQPPPVYLDTFAKIRRDIARQKAEQPEVKPEPPKPPAPFVPLLIDKLMAAQPVNSAANPADELRAREIARQLQMMRDDDEAVALLLLN